MSCPIVIHHYLSFTIVIISHSPFSVIPHCILFPIVCYSLCLSFIIVIPHCVFPYYLSFCHSPFVCHSPLSSTPIICHCTLSVISLYMSATIVYHDSLSITSNNKKILWTGMKWQPILPRQKAKQKYVTKYQYCLSSSIVYHPSLSVICHHLSFAIFCQYPLSVIHYFQLFVISHCLHTPLFAIPHCLSFPTVCHSPLSVILHCHYSLFGICHCLSFIYYLSFCIICHSPFILFPIVSHPHCLSYNNCSI